MSFLAKSIFLICLFLYFFISLVLNALFFLFLFFFLLPFPVLFSFCFRVICSYIRNLSLFLSHDYLFFYLEPNRGAQFGDKMCGPHYKWPNKPLHIPGGSLFYWFHSDGSTVDWGIKWEPPCFSLFSSSPNIPLSFTVTSWARRRAWISELERSLVWIFAKTALKKLGTVNPIETGCQKWLRSNLLKSGREADAKVLEDKDQWAKEREFLEDLIEKRNDAAKLHNKMTGGNLSSSAAQLSTITTASGIFHSPSSRSFLFSAFL